MKPGNRIDKGDAFLVALVIWGTALVLGPFLISIFVFPFFGGFSGLLGLATIIFVGAIHAVLALLFVWVAAFFILKSSDELKTRMTLMAVAVFIISLGYMLIRYPELTESNFGLAIIAAYTVAGQLAVYIKKDYLKIESK